jgi:hypothetical protein
VYAHWHGLAKLRMHTDLTLDILDSLTTILGQKLRIFDDETCSKFVTLELPREAEARKRRAAKASTKNTEGLTNSAYPLASQPSNALNLIPPPPSLAPSFLSEAPLAPMKTLHPGPALAPLDPFEGKAKVSDAKTPKTQRCKRLNLNTYKHHAYGDYSWTICRLGTTDSYSTEVVRAYCQNIMNSKFELFP